MPCIYCPVTHTERVFRLEAKDGKPLGHAGYLCLLGTFHGEWWMSGRLVPSRMPYRCILINTAR